MTDIIIETRHRSWRQRISGDIRHHRTETGVRSLSWPAVSSGAPSARSNVTIEDHLSQWNLDIETGQIEIGMRGALGSGCSSAASNKLKSRRQCCRSLGRFSAKVEQDGGDFYSRTTQALRAACGSLVFFSSLVFTDPRHLGAIWIGNIFMLNSLKTNVGSSLKAVQGFGKSILLTTLLSWPIAYWLSNTPSQMANQILLPPLTFFLSLLIMLCPWLTAPNLMILVMYVVVAAPVRFDTEWWEPVGYMASYWIGLAIALAMNLLPPQQPNTATRQTHIQMERLGKDFFLLFMQTRYYTYSTGQSPQAARAAGAAIEVLVNRISTTIQDLKQLLPAATTELGWVHKTAEAKLLADWIQYLETASSDLKMLRTAVNQRYLGETNESAPISATQIRRVIANEVGPDYHVFIDDLIHAVVACNHHADPYYTTKSTIKKNVLDATDLIKTRSQCQQAFVRAVRKVTQEVLDGKGKPGSATPVFAHMARRMTSFSSLFSIAEGLVEFAETHIKPNNDKTEKEESDDKDEYCSPFGTKKNCCSAVLTFFGACCRFMKKDVKAVGNYLVDTWWKPKWLWRDPETRRLALKTALGMFFASLWMSVPQLWEISQPFGFWPGLTVASVNLSTMGSSFHKATDRLVGTLFAAAYALLVADFFPGNDDAAKIPAITLFTFAVIYLNQDDHAYQYSYAATSIGSMLYGSVKNGYNVKGYIPQRLQLIFIGVITFAVIELFVFPKSSRLAVETKSLEVFGLVRSFLKKASDFANIMQCPGKQGDSEEKKASDFAKIDQGSDQESDSEQKHLDSESTAEEKRLDACKTTIEELTTLQKSMKAASSTLKKELQSALMEPYFGFSQKLHAQSLNGMVSEICEVEVQSLLLVNALKKISTYKHNERADSAGTTPDLPHAYATFLDKASQQMDECCKNLTDTYLDGRLRPQDGNTLKATTAAASFRDFYDVRLDIVRSWSEFYQQINYQQLFQDDSGTHCPEPNETIVIGTTTSFILELCRHLMHAGEKMERYTETFPAYN
jgi:uncharacterized membrane protein YgaE (UPF0421/DUF939 family)